MRILKTRTASMNRTLKTLALLLLIVFGCNAQQSEPADFIPTGFVLYEKHFGDLNKDGLEDCVLLIKQTDTTNIVINRFDKEVDRNRRGIIVLFKNESSYQLADQNHDCFSSENEDGGVYYAPELGIEIKNNKLYIHYEHGRYGFWKYTFRYQNGNFEMIGYDASSNYGPIVNTETSINFSTKKKLVKQNTNEDAEGGDEVFEETWSKIDIESLLKLSEIEDFDSLEMYKY